MNNRWRASALGGIPAVVVAGIVGYTMTDGLSGGIPLLGGLIGAGAGIAVDWVLRRRRIEVQLTHEEIYELEKPRQKLRHDLVKDNIEGIFIFGFLGFVLVFFFVVLPLLDFFIRAKMMLRNQLSVSQGSSIDDSL